MISKLRFKFVVCTVVLFALCFAVLITANTAYNKLCYYQDTYQELAWLGENDPQNHTSGDYSDKLNFDILYYSYNPIYCLNVDENRHLVSTQIIGGENPPAIPAKIVDKIIDSNEDDWNIGSFVFYQKNLNDDTTLYIVTDCATKTDTETLMNQLVLALTALILITIISYFLSKFIAKPAAFAISHEKQLTSDVSHELKNPIAAIKVNLSALSCQGVNSIHLDNAMEETEIMSTIVKKLLTLSRAERMENIHSPETFDLSDLVEKLSFVYDSIAFEKGITLTSSIDANVSYNGNKNDIENAISTILDNAVKYTSEGGSINISLKKSGRKKIISISDTGIGISHDDLPNIFDRFYMSDKSCSGDSFGLGLTIAKAIVHKHGGKINVTSSEGNGSKFEIIL